MDGSSILLRRSPLRVFINPSASLSLLVFMDSFLMFSHHSGSTANSLSPPVENISHIVATCPSLSVTRNRILTQFEALCELTMNNIEFKQYMQSEEILTQFCLDPASLNLKTRVSNSDPLLPQFYRLSRDLCYALDRERLDKLKTLAT